MSKSARVDEVLSDNIMKMASDIGRVGFIRQQTAILGRRDQKDTLAGFRCARAGFVWNIGCVNATKIF